MKEMNLPIDVVCKFVSGEKEPEPVRFRLTKADGSRTTVNIDQIKQIEHVTPGSNHSIMYRCVTDQDGRQVIYDIRFWVNSMKWELHRIVL